MGGKSSTITTTEPRLGTLRVQTSMYGLTVPWVRGMTRITGNLVWFGNFQAIAHTTSTSSGGKGGGGVTQVDTKYEYKAAAVLGLCRGPIVGVASAWKDKKRYGGEDASVGSTLKHTATVPTGGEVTVPLGVGTYGQNVGVTQALPDGYSNASGLFGRLVEGVDYTHADEVYTFAAEHEGAEVTITYTALGTGLAPSALAELGLSLATGVLGQPVWTWLQSYTPAQALAYSGLAYVYADSYPLTNQAEVENHSFEVISGHGISDTNPDVWPDVLLRDFLTDGADSVGWRTGRLASLAQFSDYCRARSLWLSVSMMEQKPAREWMDGFAKLCNAEWVWQGGALDLIPRGDEAATSEHGSYTPVTTPEFDLVHAEGGDLLAPVEVEPVLNEDAHNVIRIEWTNRANAYALEIMTATDAAHIELFGERPADVVPMHSIHTPEVAHSVAQQLLQREMTVWNKYRFKVPFGRALIGLMDLVTLTDADSALDRVPVRILSRSESGRMEYTYTAEDAPIGSASAPAYGAQGGLGFSHDFNAAPGNVTAPTIFEAPTERASSGLEVYAAVSGVGALWGGCRVWVSLDGLNYKDAGKLYGGSRYGTLSAALSESGDADVSLTGQGGQLLSGSAQDAQALSTLCWVAGPDGGEYFAYQTASLTAPNAYTLGGLVRGAYQNVVQVHPAGSAFVRLDQAIATSGPLTTEMIGQSLYFKFCSFNIYGGAEQTLDDVEPYSYVISGDQLRLPPPPFDFFFVDVQSDGTRALNFGYTDTPLPVDWVGGEFRYMPGAYTAPIWEQMYTLNDESTWFTVSPSEVNRPGAGEFTFAARSRDATGALSSMMLHTLTLPERRQGNVVIEFDDLFDGTLVDCHYVSTGGLLEPGNKKWSEIGTWADWGPWGAPGSYVPGTESGYLEADDTTPWTDLETIDWGDWDPWLLNPVASFEYTSLVKDIGLVITGLLALTTVATGSATVELRSSETSADPVTEPGQWTAWGSADANFTARYIQVRVTVAATLSEPIATLRRLGVSVTAPIVRDYLNNHDISTYTGANRIGVGDIRVPLPRSYGALVSVIAVPQDSSAGQWTAQLFDKDTTTGPRVQFKLDGTLTDPTLVDFILEGFAS
jgi:hypothetical protein